MGEWKLVGPDTMLADGQITDIRVDDVRMFLSRVGGNYYAAQRFCPHLGGDLSKGTLSGFVVTCPRHGSQFDVRDGHNVVWAAAWPAIMREASKVLKSPRGLLTYNTRVENGQVWVEVPGAT